LPDVSVHPKGGGPAGAAETVAVEDLTFTYAGSARPAVRAIRLSQLAGEMVGIMGASGAGKSTLAKCLNRIIPEFEGGELRGIVRIMGRRVAAPVHDLAAEVGMVFQDFEAELFSTTVEHEVAFAMEQVGMGREEMRTRLAAALGAVGLGGLELRDPTSLSGGQKQRLAIAAVLALAPKVIVLDEPTTDLDPEGRAEVFALIRRLREHGQSLIVIEHEAAELRRCDRVLVLSDGQIVAGGPPETVMTRLEMLEQCGVHPPSLNRVLDLLGIGGHAIDIDDAERKIRARFPNAPRPPATDTVAAAVDFPGPSGPRAAALLKVEAVSFTYPDGPRALDEASLEIGAGESVAIVGRNGSGKTTLAKLVVGLLRPDSGKITIDGRDRASLRPGETAREVGYVFQNPDQQIFAATVAQEVSFGPRNFGLPAEEIDRRCEEALRAVGLADHRESDPFMLGKGQRQRLAVASVLALGPRLLILDEPTTGLDYREQRRMMELVTRLNRAGVAIVMITHTPWLVAEYARRVLLMRGGQVLFDGGVRDFFADDAMLAGSSFRPPEVTALSRRFGTVALAPDEFAAWLRERAR
jgi:energy-coupling factor transport system ATP-binding protein